MAEEAGDSAYLWNVDNDCLYGNKYVLLICPFLYLTNRL